MASDGDGSPAPGSRQRGLSWWGFCMPAAPAESWGRGEGDWVFTLALDSPLACAAGGVALSGFAKPGSNQ